MQWHVLFEDNHLLAVSKPSGMLVHADSTGDISLEQLAQCYRKEKENKPGNAYIGLVHRLDRPVSGLVLLTKTSKAAARLTKQFQQGTVKKEYLAVVPSGPQSTAQSAGDSSSGQRNQWEDWLLKDESRNVTRIVAPERAQATGARRAVTRYRPIEQRPPWQLLGLEPVTGRSHQLRVQCASRGLPILGDQKYGSRETFPGIALHAYSIQFEHPTTKEPVHLHAPLPESWRRFSWKFTRSDLNRGGFADPSGSASK